MSTQQEEREAPIRVCRKCSAQAQTGGEFCPHCGARYATRQRSAKARLLMIGLPVVILLIAGGVAAALVVHHNNQVAAQHRAAEAKARRVAAARLAARRAAQRQAQAAARVKRAAAQAKADLAKIERQSIVNALQGAVKNDAEKDVSDGVLNGPIMKVQCQPATAVDATAPIASYTCLAATSESNGVLSGYRFSASINVNTGSYSWHLGG